MKKIIIYPLVFIIPALMITGLVILTPQFPFWPWLLAFLVPIFFIFCVLFIIDNELSDKAILSDKAVLNENSLLKFNLICRGIIFCILFLHLIAAIAFFYIGKLDALLLIFITLIWAIPHFLIWLYLSFHKKLIIKDKERAKKLNIFAATLVIFSIIICVLVSDNFFDLFRRIKKIEHNKTVSMNFMADSLDKDTVLIDLV